MSRAWVLVVALAACATAEQTPDAPTGGSADAPIDGANEPDASASDAAPDACAPSAEVCNGVNDDCDSGIDEDFPTLGQACSAGMGACLASGSLVCDGPGTGVTCDALVGMPQTETCNSIDDDCDGPTDEGLGLGTACDGGDGDLCDEGVLVCGTGSSVVCDDATGTNVETCNSVNDDCDGTTDEGFPVGATCMVGVGACQANGQQICSGDGTTTVCNATPGTPTAETCGDGIDQDCNGGEPTCPSNDVPGGAIDISSGGTFTVDVSASHDDDNNTTTGCGLSGGRDAFYQFTLGATEVVYADTFTSNYDTVIRIYTGACTVRTGTPWCDDDAGVCSGLQSQLAVQLVAGTYCLVVDQYSSAQTNGATLLSFVRGGRPGTLLGTGSSSVSGTTSGQPNRSTGTCQTSSTAGDAGYYWTACPSTSMTISANTCNTGSPFDTVLYVHQGNGTGTIGSIACSDDDVTCGTSILRSRIPSTVVSGPGLFWMIIDGYQAQTGAYQITYTLN
jgi:hypothetical protein